jgi:8-oxo-dGTP diphosphatase
MDNTQTRAFAGAFLRCGDEVLLMHRSIHKKIGPGLWAGVGGHIEREEASSPVTACLREIEEETGILPEQIEHLSLRYFALLKEEPLDTIYYFVGELKSKPERLIDTDEGTLHWVKLPDGLKLEMAAFMKAFYAHWVEDLQGDSFHCFVEDGIGRLQQ